MPDAIKLLEEDHREVESLFSKAKENSGAAKAQVVSKIAKELTIHSEVEESIVYPAMANAGLGDLVREAEREHQQVKELVTELEEADGSSGDVDGLLSTLESEVEHHVEEEEGEAFPKFREAVDHAMLESLGDKVEETKHRLEQSS